MGKLLFIGSTVADVVLRVDALPQTGDDLNLRGQSVALGGCALNAYRAARLLGGDAALFSPVGGGVWGEWVRGALRERGIPMLIPPVPEENGCCYCLVEDGGERTFLCGHGAEYRFRPEWFAALAGQTFAGVYVCGLEVEEPAGDAILAYLARSAPGRLYFAPGPRLCHIPPARMAALLRLHPVLHLSEGEALRFTRAESVRKAAALLRGLTDADVVVTLGERGAYVLTAAGGQAVDGFPAQVEDLIGAGDAHAGAVMACADRGMDLARAAREANRLAAAVASVPGAEVTPAQWAAWQKAHP